ncbi:MAG: glycosyltransferase family 4 protein [Deltaproteobacteria bacterium]|nr:glycosyltransferase family 4 protein [Deltaproteobacteria bacterium]MBW2361873.1 glycosyltransferase family 4 protein [Deltaproteobacteria bacterium]
MPDSMRVLLLNERDPLHPRAGGAEVHIAEIAKRLAPRGIAMTQLAVGFSGGAAREQLEGLEVRRLGPVPFYYPRAVATTAWETRRGRWDVVVEHLNKVPFCARAYAAGPVLAVNHHLFGQSAFLQVAWPIAATVVAIEKLIPHIYRNVPCLAVSESSRDDLVRRGLPREQIGLLHNGITFPARQPIEVSARPCRVAYLGRLESYKRIDRLLRACAGLVERFPQLEIVLIGRGAERGRLEALAAELGIAERTRFTGFVSDAERDALLAEARVAVCASVKEGWGLTVIECNALGVPVVATDAPGLRDAVRHDETGLLVPAAAAEVFSERLRDAIGGLLADELTLARLATEAHRWAQRFDWDRSADVMAEALRETAASA